MPRKMFALFCLSLVLSACQSSNTDLPTPGAALPPQKIATIGNDRYIRDEVVVGYRDQASLQAAVKQLGGEVIATIPEIKTALVKVPGDAFKLAARGSKVPGIAFSQPNFVNATTDPVQTQPDLNRLNATDQIFDEYPQYALDPRHLNAKAAWDAGLTGKGVVVAVIDDPADVSHPDLAANWIGKAYDPLTDKVFTDPAEWVKFVKNPENSHGTFVTSTIAAAKDGKGITGVAPEAKFMPVIKFNPQDYSRFLTARGIVWAVNNGAKVLNNSWGGGGGYDMGPVRLAFDYALSSGVTVVASAGNSYRDEYQFPAGMPGLIASAALDASNRKVTFSTAGRHISTGAPGQDILMANPTWLGGGYDLASGTSFSGPYTAGVAALVLQKCPAATPYQVKRVMELNADGSIGSNPGGFDRETGWGRLDAGTIARNLKDCAQLPPKGANVEVMVEFQDVTGTAPGYTADVMLRGKGFKPGAKDDSTPWYMASTDQAGHARFTEIAPGEYDLYVAGADLSLTGGKPEERGTYVGALVATSGSTYLQPVQKRVVLTAKIPDFNPVDPYEPNDTPATAKPIQYGQTTDKAYIFGKPQDADYFVFEGKKGDKITADVLAKGRLGGTLDSYLFLIDTDGQKVLAENDDRGEPRIDSDSTIEFALPADGKYYLKVSSCPISCDPKHPQDDDSPFNMYKLSLKK